MPFDAKTIKLDGRKIIEASAGTGKTFSIAVMALRVIIETDPEIELKKILMVTFTNAAVAELEIRIRRFIREAYAYAVNGTNPEKEIKLLLDSYRNDSRGISNERIKDRLSRAVQALDELNVMTIHSFCQETLKEFSFETKSVFESEIITDESEILETVINEFWRKEIAVLDPKNLEALLDFFDRQNSSQTFKLRRLLTDALKCRLDNKLFFINDTTDNGDNPEIIIENYLKRISEIEDNYFLYVRKNEKAIRELSQRNGNARKLTDRCKTPEELAEEYYKVISKGIIGYFRIELLELLKKYCNLKSGNICKTDFEAFLNQSEDEFKKSAEGDEYAYGFVEKLYAATDRLNYMEKKFSSDYIRDSFPQLYTETIERITEEAVLKKEIKQHVLNLLLYRLTLHEDNEGKYFPMASSIKKTKNYIGYDDMISKVHDTRERVKEELMLKYEVLFIDEFQDTDKYQYEIFDRVFENKRVFFIGDPKQSIYGWRKADLNTYKAAREKIREADPDSVAEMNRNFRSTPRMLEALNLFFSSVDNMFIDNQIRYYPVCPGKPEMEEMKMNNKNVVPITIIEHDEESLELLPGKEKKNHNKDSFYQSIIDFVASETERVLFSGEFTINGKPIESKDIGILVRTNEEARDIKEALTQKNIQAITLDTTQILNTPEAEQLFYIMNAVNRPSKKSINRALLNRNLGFTTTELAKKKDEEILGEFDRLRETWKTDGIYGMLSSFIDRFSVRGKCTEKSNKGGLRTLSNYYQLMEILHDFETKGKLKEDDLISKFSKAMNLRTKDDEYVQRIESDEDAVKIVTIHKSKGLEYEVVFAPFLDLTSWTKDIVEYRDADKGKYFFALNDKGELQRRNLDAIDQENRRLIYVALTRAIYKCYINVNYFRKFERASVKPFIEALKEKSAKSGWQNDLIEILKVSPVTPPERPEDNKEISLKESRSVEGIEQFVKTWDIHSFSSLSHKHEVITSEPAEINDPYDKFVFDELPRGAKAGLFLHSIFEHLDFNDPGTYEKAIDEAGSYYSTIFKLEHRQHYKNLVKHCMNAWVKDEKGVKLLQLKDVRQSEKLPELEFYFSLDRLRKSKIREIIKDVEFTTDPEIEGVMHGFIDLLFMHNNKYYILDWKSNFLGNKLEDYERKGMEEGMRGSNYHLQYYIYTLAVKRHLERKLKGFDYERDFGGVIYMFLRGVREDGNTGIFTAWPSKTIMDDLDKAFRGELLKAD